VIFCLKVEVPVSFGDEGEVAYFTAVEDNKRSEDRVRNYLPLDFIINVLTFSYGKLRSPVCTISCFVLIDLRSNLLSQ